MLHLLNTNHKTNVEIVCLRRLKVQTNYIKLESDVKVLYFCCLLKHRAGRRRAFPRALLGKAPQRNWRADEPRREIVYY